MTDRTVASTGFVLAGLAIAVTFLPWPPENGLIASGFALIAFLAFASRRYGILGDRPTMVVAGVAGIGLLGVAVLSLIQAAQTTDPILGPGLSAGTAILFISMAVADWRGVTNNQFREMLSVTAIMSGVGILGLVAIVIWTLIIVQIVLAVSPGEIDPSLATALSTLALGLGTGSVAVLYLHQTDHEITFIDLRWPGIRDLGYVVGGVIAIIALNIIIGVIFQQLSIESAPHSVVSIAEGNPEILLILIPLSYLVIGPGEEILYRNIVQKTLYGVFSRIGAIIVGSAIFAGVHLFAYSGPNATALETINTLVVVFLLSLVLAIVYDRTRNVLVPALVHGSFDAIAFAAIYAQLTGLGA